VRSRQHYKKCAGRLFLFQVAALLPVVVGLHGSSDQPHPSPSKASAFDNVCKSINWKKPLRDKVLTDSIHVKSQVSLVLNQLVSGVSLGLYGIVFQPPT
jgi:hypothetical protein